MLDQFISRFVTATLRINRIILILYSDVVYKIGFYLSLVNLVIAKHYHNCGQ